MLTDEIVEFLGSGVSILLASRDAAFVPSVARGRGCRVVRGEPPQLRLIVSAAQAGGLLDDVRGSGMFSATFTQPATHRTLQFKGSDARVEALDDADRTAAAAYQSAFAAAIRPLGYDDPFARAYFASPGDDVAVVFTPAAAFQQTPGAAAGKRIA